MMFFRKFIETFHVIYLLTNSENNTIINVIEYMGD